MLQFVVPQFIDVEAKIIGPITTRQFILMLGGGLGIFLAFRFADFTLFLTLTIIIVFLVIIFAFVNVNSRPFHLFLINFIQTVVSRPMLRVWKREEGRGSLYHKKVKKKKEILTPEDLAKKTTTRTRISELSLIVDTGGVYTVEEEKMYGP